MCEGANKRGAGAQGLQQCNRHRALINFTGRENILVMKFKEVLAPQRAWDKHSNQGYKEKCASTWNSRLKIFSWMYSLKKRRKKKVKTPDKLHSKGRAPPLLRTSLQYQKPEFRVACAEEKGI